MSVMNADGVTHVTSADWDALREQCSRVLAENADVRHQALEARSDAVEERLRSEANRLERGEGW